MPVAVCLIRDQPAYRSDAFCSGLRKVGYKVERTWRTLSEGDLLIIWNRYGRYHSCANEAERNGARVIVAENGYFGRDAVGGPWYAISLGWHNGAGYWPGVQPRAGNQPLRAGSLPLRRMPWRVAGSEVILLPQRGIGSPGIAMPMQWASTTLRTLQKRFRDIPFRVRYHPGERGKAPPLEHDLKDASSVVTWGSGAALKALDMGIPVFYEFSSWIGKTAASPLSSFPNAIMDDNAREELYESVAWAQWNCEEISTGLPFKYLLGLN